MNKKHTSLPDTAGGDGNPPVKIRMSGVELSGGSPSTCYASRGMTYIYKKYVTADVILRNDVFINFEF